MNEVERMDQNFAIIFKRKNLPDKPGVYIYKDSNGKVIYIGKAKSLKKRVSQYFNNKFTGSSQDILYSEKIKRLVNEIEDIDFIITENEKEALLLENDMIKKYQPKYNAQLKDDKSFPWIMITYSEEFPRILVIRQPHKLYRGRMDNTLDINRVDKFLGPYIDVSSMRDMLNFLRKNFPYCTCKTPCKKKNKPCLYYQLKLCSAPCAGKISREKYLENIKQIDQILSGNIDQIIKYLNDKMLEASKLLQFEKAAEYRDKIKALNKMIEKQAVIKFDPANSQNQNIDVIGIYRTFNKIGILILHIRNGRIFGKTPIIEDTNKKIGKDEEIIFSLLEQFYLNLNSLSIDEIILPSSFFRTNIQKNSNQIENLKDRKAKKKQLESRNDAPFNVDYIQERIKLFKSAIKKRFNKDILISNKEENPYIKKLKNIVEKNVSLVVKLNAEYSKLIADADILIEEGINADLIAKMNKKDRNILLGLKEIKDILSLNKLPRVIEGIDISNWQQDDAVGAVVVFIDGKPYKSEYRNYIIKTKQNQGDTQMMAEVAKRRYSKLLQLKNPNPNKENTNNTYKSNNLKERIENKNEKYIQNNINIPDLIIVDGGKGQVGAVASVLNNLGLNIPIIGLTKKKTHTYIDHIVFLNENGDYKEIKLNQFTPGYNLLQNISQEYHRRAIQHHRKRVSKRMFKSPLEDIPGIGKKTKEKLIESFGDMDSIRNAYEEDLIALFGPNRGKKIYNALKEAFKE
ncbi:MAG: excinuclease ABC subunit UvrC [Promethearchaeota archaeon]